MEILEKLTNLFQNYNYANIPITQIILVILILCVTQVLRRVIPRAVVKTVKRLFKKTGGIISDDFLAAVKISVSWLLLIAGLWLVQLVIADKVSSLVNETFSKVLSLGLIFVVALFVYRTAYVFGRILTDGIFHTDTELDDLLRLFVPKVFQTTAIILVVLKGSELFLGASAAALVGLLGGAGITLGLLFKDMIYDWFCTVIIYTDSLYKEGDWLEIEGIDGFTEVVNIGFRSTTLYTIMWSSIIKIPNSKMITGIVENRSQDKNNENLWGLSLDVKVDGISARKTARVFDGISEILKTVENLSPQSLVRLPKLEENARVFKIMAFVCTVSPALYFKAEKDINIAILHLLEQEGVELLNFQVEYQPESQPNISESTLN